MPSDSRSACCRSSRPISDKPAAWHRRSSSPKALCSRTGSTGRAGAAPNSGAICASSCAAPRALGTPKRDAHTRARRASNAYGTPASPSRALTAGGPPCRTRNSLNNRVLPTPAGPTITTERPAFTASSRHCHSACRPTSAGGRSRAGGKGGANGANGTNGASGTGAPCKGVVSLRITCAKRSVSALGVTPNSQRSALRACSCAANAAALSPRR